jgi:hypothetical protein
MVSVAEVVRGVEIMLGRAPIDDCENLDLQADGVTLDDLVRAVRSALRGCAP